MKLGGQNAFDKKQKKILTKTITGSQEIYLLKIRDKMS